MRSTIAGRVGPSASSMPWRKLVQLIVGQQRRRFHQIGLRHFRFRAGDVIAERRVVGEDQQAGRVQIQPARRKHPLLATRRADRRPSAALRIFISGQIALGFVQQQVNLLERSLLARISGWPSSVTRSSSGSTQASGVWIFLPFTVTRPAPIHCALRCAIPRRLSRERGRGSARISFDGICDPAALPLCFPCLCLRGRTSYDRTAVCNDRMRPEFFRRPRPRRWCARSLRRDLGRRRAYCCSAGNRTPITIAA